MGNQTHRMTIRKHVKSVPIPCYSLGMTTGLERVARALCELDANPPDATMNGMPLWQDYLPEAWAAIMALREPDTAMIGAAAIEAVRTGNGEFGRIFRAMIDAAMIE
jgi:hypothetical protein